MATYVTLGHFTEKGFHDIKDTVKRVETFKEQAKKHGVTVKEILWTQGAYDMVSIIEAPDGETFAALMLNVAKLGNIRAQSLRGFTAAEIEKILEKVN